MMMRSRLAATHHLPPTSILAKKQTSMLLRIDDLEIEDIQSPGQHLSLRIKDPHLLRNMAPLELL
jgi:hypothetical protein